METIHGVKGVQELFPEKEEKGIAKISPFEFKNEGMQTLTNLRLARDAEWWFQINEGKYVRLVVNGELMMSDTGMERYSNREFIKKANGKILIAGLGIGMVLKNILDKPEVTEVLVIEKYQDVIDLVKPKFNHPKLKVIQENIFNYKTKEKFDVIYFDIWPSINTDNLEEIKILHNKFKYNLNRTNSNCFMDSWLKKYLQNIKRKESRNSWRYW